MQHVDDNQHMMKLKENTERFLRAMAEAGKHDMLLGLIETKTDFDINGQFMSVYVCVCRYMYGQFMYVCTCTCMVSLWMYV
jgi:hypothetical protein